MDSFVHMTVPEDHVVMISFPLFFLPNGIMPCSSHTFLIYVGGNSSADIVQKDCVPAPPPAVYNTTDVFVRLTSDDLIVRASLTMQFTFHNRTATPEKLQDGKWNCSVTFWSDFQLHFPCNFRSECVGHEDEVGCPYSSALCGAGDFSVAGKCFRYVRATGFNMTWNEASEACSQRGARLASLNTRETWDNVTRLLHQHEQGRTAFIGLTSSSPVLPFMYVSATYAIVRTENLSFIISERLRSYTWLRRQS